ncbi:hypothetical protein ACTOB_004723 [Actinoplanes oblitus]|uniref:STAS domain-containing protein n=1 Tax=Actinoplanes oblitus TaxID=3040509 RepID=A0ABY8W4Z3_9ACTN|nr:hypothetical protein [Actinoplanes oblitus]WIM92768.1 hypothetical protein ACTOB_004723 [Actinoplanes oblitus]
MTFLDVRALTAIALAESRLPGLTVRATRGQRELLTLVRDTGAVPPQPPRPFVTGPPPRPAPCR